MSKRLAVLFGIVAATALVTGVFVPVAPFEEEMTLFTVERGQGSREIGVELERARLIRWAGLFRVYALSVGASQDLKAGTYELSRAMSLHEIVSALAKGDVFSQRATVPEGWNIKDIASAFEARGMFEAVEFYELAGFPGVDYRTAPDLPSPKEYGEEYPFLASKPPYVGLEGYLFPDTYEIRGDETAEEMMRRMLGRFEEKVGAEVRAEAARQGTTLHEVLATASLLEKEVRTPKDKRTVAGVLKNRLELGMPLQVDATVTYLTGKTSVSIQDTKIDSSYNTYRYRGLPPGPIANPGLDSIEAALNPADTPFLYYLSTPQGETVFSRTLQEHNEAKAAYLR